VTAVLLALLSALAYGTYSFVGGLASRQASAWSVSFVVLSANALTLLIASPWVPSAARSTDLLWGVIGGVGSGVGVGFLFRGLAGGNMSVVAPVAAVVGAVLPVAAGFVFGERVSPLMSVGLVVGIPAIFLISTGSKPAHHPDAAKHGTRPSAWHGIVDRHVLDGCVAGAAFALAYIAIDRIASDAGLWPLFAMQSVSAGSVALLAVALGTMVRPLTRPALRAWYAGPFGALACTCFYLSTSRGMLTLTAVLASFNSAVTVLLALVVLRERVTHAQVVGLVMAAACILLAVVG
jgi:drug/metabolite transporter (DMT)-like permease